MYSVTSFLVSTSFEIDCLLELYKLSFILWLYFSDVLNISFKELSIISLYEVFKVHLTVLSVIRNLNSLKSLITGNTSYLLKQALLVIFF